jgi:hypothetical protein
MVVKEKRIKDLRNIKLFIEDSNNAVIHEQIVPVSRPEDELTKSMLGHLCAKQTIKKLEM